MQPSEPTYPDQSLRQLLREGAPKEKEEVRVAGGRGTGPMPASNLIEPGGELERNQDSEQ